MSGEWTQERHEAARLSANRSESADYLGRFLHSALDEIERLKNVVGQQGANLTDYSYEKGELEWALRDAHTVTDEMVERAALAQVNHHRGCTGDAPRTSLDELPGGTEAAEDERAGMRAALEAALGVKA